MLCSVALTSWVMLLSSLGLARLCSAARKETNAKHEVSRPQSCGWGERSASEASSLPLHSEQAHLLLQCHHHQPTIRTLSTPQERAGSRAGSPRITFLLHRKQTFTTLPQGLYNHAPKSPSPSSPKANPTAECQKELRTAPKLPGQQRCPTPPAQVLGSTSTLEKPPASALPALLHHSAQPCRATWVTSPWDGCCDSTAARPHCDGTATP